MTAMKIFAIILYHFSSNFILYLYPFIHKDIYTYFSDFLVIQGVLIWSISVVNGHCGQ